MKSKLSLIYILQALAYTSGVWYPNRSDLKKIMFAADLFHIERL